MSETYQKVIVKLEYGTLCTNKLDLQTHLQLRERQKDLLECEKNLKSALALIEKERAVLLKRENFLNHSRPFKAVR